jgi:hypothetical protein
MAQVGLQLMFMEIYCINYNIYIYHTHINIDLWNTEGVLNQQRLWNKGSTTFEPMMNIAGLARMNDGQENAGYNRGLGREHVADGSRGSALPLKNHT